MNLPLNVVVADFAAAFKAVDETRPQGSSRSRTYRPGIGPLAEAEAIQRALEKLRTDIQPRRYEKAVPRTYPGSRQKCDLVIPGEWAIEFKLIRPFGDNGEEAEHWSENILHPYPGNVSSIGDALKLLASGFSERKAIIVFGYEHTPPKTDLTVAIAAFEQITREVVGLKLGPRHAAEFSPLIHPVHQQGKVFGWEVLSSGA